MNIEYHREKNRELCKMEENKESVCLLMCGRFNSGKTSLLNMILGLDLPVKAVTATGAVTKIAYDAVMSVDFRDGRSRQVSEEELGKYIIAGNKGVDNENPEEVVTVHVPCRHSLLRRGKVEFWDTPGLEDDERLTDITMEAVKECDIAVLVMDADRLASRYEREFLSEIQEFLGGNLIVVVNRMDFIHEEERNKFVESVEALVNGFGNKYCGIGQAVYTSARQDYPDIGDLFCRIYHICMNPLLVEQCRVTAKEAKIRTTARRWADELEKDIYQHQQLQKELKEKYKKEMERLYEVIEDEHRKDARRVRDKLYERIEESDNMTEWENALEGITTQKGWEKNYTASSQRILEAEVHTVYKNLQKIVETELDRQLYSECFPLPSEPYNVQWENMSWGVNFDVNEYRKRSTIGEKIQRFFVGLFAFIIAAVGVSFISLVFSGSFEGYAAGIIGVALIILGIYGVFSSDGYVAGKVRTVLINRYKDDCIPATLATFQRNLDASVKTPMREYVKKILDCTQASLERRKKDALATLNDQLLEIEKVRKEEEELVGYYKISKLKLNYKMDMKL